MAENDRPSMDKAENKKKLMSESEKTSVDEIEKINKRIYTLRLCEMIATGVLLLLIFISLMIVVVIQINNNTTDYQTAATIVNTYTSIVLGFVAMTVSLIGMVLSFHNTIQTEQSNLTTTKEFSNLSNSISRLNELEERLERDLNKISERTSDLEKKMGAFDSLNDQMSSIQGNLMQISIDIRNSIDQSKGSSSEAVKNIKPNFQDATNILTDE